MPRRIELFPLALLALPAIGMIIQYALARLRLRRAGITAQRPGCPNCLYLVRGWKSSKCPECGSDVAAGGVVFGPTVSKSLVILSAGIWGVLVCGFIAFTVCTRLFMEHQWSASMTFRSDADRDCVVTVQTTGAQRGLMLSNQVASRVEIQKGKVASKLMIETGAEPPTREELMRTITEVAGNLEPAVLAALTTDALKELSQQRWGGSSHQHAWQHSLQPGGLNQAGGSWTSRSDTSTLGTVIALVLTLAGTIAFISIGCRMCPDGRRPVREGEWGWLGY